MTDTLSADPTADTKAEHSNETPQVRAGRPAPVAVPDAAAEGLLAALTLAPATWSRNRFFELYKVPKMQDIRRRAGLLRSLVRHLHRGDVEGLREQEDGERAGHWLISYRVPELGLSRRVVLSRFEQAVLRVTLARARGESAQEPWKSVVDAALLHLDHGRLAPA
jgi:hypothetical protein